MFFCGRSSQVWFSSLPPMHLKGMSTTQLLITTTMDNPVTIWGSQITRIISNNQTLTDAMQQTLEGAHVCKVKNLCAINFLCVMLTSQILNYSQVYKVSSNCMFHFFNKFWRIYCKCKLTYCIQHFAGTRLSNLQIFWFGQKYINCLYIYI